MNQIDILTQLFKEFPGIGERQAKRFVYFLLHKNPAYIKDLSDAIIAVKNAIKQCPSCYLFFQSNNSTLCETCANPKTDHTSLLIIEKDADYESIKKSKNYNGMYFILGGLIPIVTRDTPNFVRINELMKVIDSRFAEKGLKEIIIALSLNPQGENTDTYIRELLNKYDSKIKISSLGRGLSTGSELEYADSETIKNALRNRS